MSNLFVCDQKLGVEGFFDAIRFSSTRTRRRTISQKLKEIVEEAECIYEDCVSGGQEVELDDTNNTNEM